VSRPRAHLVVTGSELVRGERTDLNGPFLARQLLSLGLEPARISIVGDRPDELEEALREGIRADLCVVSGGLGPTHDDRTVELLARAAGRPLRHDPELESRIEEISRRHAERTRRPYADYAPGVRKQATLPEGAFAVGIAGTAPAVLLPLPGDRAAVALPGPPDELQALWPKAVAHEAFRPLLRRAVPPGRRVLRFYGVGESVVARAFDEAGGDGDGVEVTICARDFEIHVDLVVEPGAEMRADAIEQSFLAANGQFLFARDERPVEELVLALCRARGLTLATAESCTGGLVGARLTSVAGSSDVFLGGVIAYANAAKVALLGVPEATLAAFGSVSAETAAAMARGARERIGARVAVSVTGVAGPGGGTKEKPVGLVHFAASGPGGDLPLEWLVPGDRETIRRRAASSALHLVYRLLSQG
jgi:nicotinamide-nucleotide amidase